MSSVKTAAASESASSLRAWRSLNQSGVVLLGQTATPSARTLQAKARSSAIGQRPRDVQVAVHADSRRALAEALIVPAFLALAGAIRAVVAWRLDRA